MIVFGVNITTKASDQRYDPGVKGQGQIYLKSDLLLITLYFNGGCSYLAQ